jgi:hypothetical protein
MHRRPPPAIPSQSALLNNINMSSSLNDIDVTGDESSPDVNDDDMDVKLEKNPDSDIDVAAANYSSHSNNDDARGSPEVRHDNVYQGNTRRSSQRVGKD